MCTTVGPRLRPVWVARRALPASTLPGLVRPGPADSSAT